MEKELLACALNSREDYELILNYLNTKGNSFSKEFQFVLTKVGEYYARDKESVSATPAILKAQIEGDVRNDKVLARLSDLLDEAAAASASSPNVRVAVLAAKRQEIADKLSVALVNGEFGSKVDELIVQLQELDGNNKLPGEISEDNIHINIDLEALVASEYDPTNLIKVYPEAVNRRLDGGAKKGHHIVVFARPEAGKSAFVINATCGFARQGKRVLYLINEDRAEDIILRIVSNLSGMDKHSIRDNPKVASVEARNNGWDNIIVVDLAPGTPSQIRALIKKYQPDCVIVDQLRNLKVRSDNRTNQLEMAATEIRNIGKELDVLMLSVTQAGDSADGQLILGHGDIDYSNTGIPAQADVLVGIGVNDEYYQKGLRVVNLSKNKVGAVHEHFPIRLVQALSRYVSV